MNEGTQLQVEEGKETKESPVRYLTKREKWNRRKKRGIYWKDAMR